MSSAHNANTRRRGRSVYRVNARANGSGTAVIDAAGSPILFDAAWDSRTEGLPEPAEVLASALAACLLKNLSRSRSLFGFRYDAAEVDVMVEQQERPPRFVAVGYTLRVRTDEPQRRVDLMHENVRRYGAVLNTLASVCEVRGSVEVLPRVVPESEAPLAVLETEATLAIPQPRVAEAVPMAELAGAGPQPEGSNGHHELAGPNGCHEAAGSNGQHTAS